MAIENKNERLGTMSDSEVKWPNLSISGAIYERKNGVSLSILGSGYFAVKDHYPMADENALILELTEYVQGLSAPKVSKSASVTQKESSS